MQYVSSTPATRLDVITLQEKLDQQLQQRQVCQAFRALALVSVRERRLLTLTVSLRLERQASVQ